MYLPQVELKEPTEENTPLHPSCSYLKKILTVKIKLVLIYSCVYSELSKEKVKPKIKVSDLSWMRKNEIHGIKDTEKEFRSHPHICKCLEINTAQARAVNKDEHCSQLLYHLSIWSATVNAKFSSCKIDVNECLLQKRLKSEYLLSGMLLRQSDKRFQNYCAEISKGNGIFCSCSEVNTQDSSISLEEMQSVFQENAFLLFKRPAKPYLFHFA